MLFDDITTIEERSRGYLPAKVIKERCLATPRYCLNPHGQGGSVYIASIGIEKDTFEIEFNFDPIDPGETDLLWHYPSDTPNSNSLQYLSGYVPLTSRALVATLSATFGLCPDMVAHKAVNLQVYWEQSNLDSTDFSLPPPETAHLYRLLG